MKKIQWRKKLLVISCFSLGLVLTGCSSDVEAQPKNISSPIVDFVDKDTDYFRNTIETIYDNLIDGGTTNTTIFNELVTRIAENEVIGSFADEAKITEICQEQILDAVKGGSYSTNRLFDEEKYVNSLRSSYPTINFADSTGKINYNKLYLIGPEDTFEDVFKADYTEYIEKQLKPEVLKKLLTAKYLCENSISSLSRASARDVQYIKLENFKNKAGEVNKLILEWLGNYISEPTGEIDLDELQAIYKGVELDTEGLTGDELARAERINGYISRYYTLANEIDEDLSKIVEKDENGNLKKDENGNYVLLNRDDTDQDIEDTYTGSGAYTVEWGEELKVRELYQKDFTGDDIYTRSEGISDLPSEVTERLFSASIASYISTGDNGGVAFLTPKNTLNGSSLGKYYTYDSSSDAYYIVVVNKYYTSSVINGLIENNTVDGKVTYTDDIIDISYGLADSSTNQRNALVYYLQQYDVGSNIHDQDFYDYIVSNYSEIIK